jgi:hypothetical protein
MKKQKPKRKIRETTIMSSSSLDSPSSDAVSFDEYDMYGSDPDVETISLSSSSKMDKPDADEHTVRSSFTSANLSYVTMNAG